MAETLSSDARRYPVQRAPAFALFAHSCLGQPVARQEIMTAIKAPHGLTGGPVNRGPGPLHVQLH